MSSIFCFSTWEYNLSSLLNCHETCYPLSLRIILVHIYIRQWKDKIIEHIGEWKDKIIGHFIGIVIR